MGMHDPVPESAGYENRRLHGMLPLFVCDPSSMTAMPNSVIPALVAAACEESRVFAIPPRRPDLADTYDKPRPLALDVPGFFARRTRARMTATE